MSYVQTAASAFTSSMVGDGEVERTLESLSPAEIVDLKADLQEFMREVRSHAAQRKQTQRKT